MSTSPIPLPPTRYQQVKQYITDKIMSGEWRAGHRIPTEEELVASLGISRMTIHRALRELVAEGFVRRKAGAGTFVEHERPSLDLLQVRNIADEIKGRGHRHESKVHLLEEVTATAESAQALGLAAGIRVFHSVIVHLENAWPVQLEERYVNPSNAPAYLKQDYLTITTNAYLSTTGPLERTEHNIEAIRPTALMCDLLKISPEEPCLQMHRRTWSNGGVTSRAWLTHPGSRYRIGQPFNKI